MLGGRASPTRAMFVPLSVLSFSRVPSSTKSGTFTMRPVSIFAGFVPPVAVSPL